jgi:sensor domain DACNV-containing protein
MSNRQAYPSELAAYTLEQWPRDVELGLSREQLADILSVCFLASLTTDEGRPVRFRLLLVHPDTLPAEGEPNHGVLRLRFDRSRTFDADELRRLSPAVPFETALIGAHLEGGELRIWGIAHSGASWLAPSWGGRDSGVIWTSAPIIHVTGPGRVAVRSSGRLVAGLERGSLVSSAMDVFESRWLPRLFEEARRDLLHEHRDGSGAESGVIDKSLIQTLAQHMLRRVTRLVRGAGHGGMILVADVAEAERYRSGIGAVRLKYGFRDEEPRGRYNTLVHRLMASLGAASTAGSIGWADFRDSDDPVLSEIEESVFEISRLIASLAATDGAVLLNKRFDLIGFGAEVSAELPAPSRVWRATDIEADHRECDLAESVGTRHRAAYRFVQHHPQGIAAVISADGAVRFVASLGHGVTYWEQSMSP